MSRRLTYSDTGGLRLKLAEHIGRLAGWVSVPIVPKDNPRSRRVHKGWSIRL